MCVRVRECQLSGQATVGSRCECSEPASLSPPRASPILAASPFRLPIFAPSTRDCDPAAPTGLSCCCPRVFPPTVVPGFAAVFVWIGIACGGAGAGAGAPSCEAKARSSLFSSLAERAVFFLCRESWDLSAGFCRTAAIAWWQGRRIEQGEDVCRAFPCAFVVFFVSGGSYVHAIVDQLVCLRRRRIELQEGKISYLLARIFHCV